MTNNTFPRGTEPTQRCLCTTILPIKRICSVIVCSVALACGSCCVCRLVLLAHARTRSIAICTFVALVGSRSVLYSVSPLSLVSVYCWSAGSLR
jgi:hypothetical protein